MRASRIFSYNSKLYSTRIGSVEYPQDICRLHMSCYDPYSNAWTSLPVSEGNTCLWRIFVNNKDEMFALFLERCGWDHYRGWRIRNGRRTKNVSSADNVPRKEPKRNMFPSLCDINLNYISGKKSHLSITWCETAFYHCGP